MLCSPPRQQVSSAPAQNYLCENLAKALAAIDGNGDLVSIKHNFQILSTALSMFILVSTDKVGGAKQWG